MPDLFILLFPTDDIDEIFEVLVTIILLGDILFCLGYFCIANFLTWFHCSGDNFLLTFNNWILSFSGIPSSGKSAAYLINKLNKYLLYLNNLK